MGCASSKGQPVVEAPPFSVDRPTMTSPAGGNQADRPPVVVPSDPGFGSAKNGRNGWKVSEIYQSRAGGSTDSAALGQGSFGSVTKARNKFRKPDQDNEWHTVAIKTTTPTEFDRRHGRIKSYEDVETKVQEVKTLRKLRQSEGILHLYEFFWSATKRGGRGELYLVTELLGQELDDWRKEQEVFNEGSVQRIAEVLLSALAFMHSRNVVHRDLKFQNVLFKENGKFETLKIVDFGLAKVLEGDRSAKDFCGTPGYIAPEMYLGEAHRFEVDLFAFGVLLFRLLSGVKPFPGSAEQVRNKTVSLQYNVQGANWREVSPNARKLIRMLLIGKDQRLDANQAAEHSWFEVQETSILHADYSQSRDYKKHLDKEEAIALSHIPSEHARRSNGNLLLDIALELPINILISEGVYTGRLVPTTEDQVEVEENMPPGKILLPAFMKTLKSYNELDCRKIFRQVVEIVKLSHENGLAHRNLHLNNVVVDHRTRSVMLRGLHQAQPIQPDQRMTGHFGALYDWYAFKAPEIDNDFYHDQSVDIWSLGALLYMMLTALPPFRGDADVLISNKHKGDVVFDMIVPSRQAQELVRGMLQVEPGARMSLDQIVNAEWMIEADDVLSGFDLSLTSTMFFDWK